MTTTKENPKKSDTLSGILLINKSIDTPSFDLIRSLRKATNVRKIGHAGTLDPFATGVMILLIGKTFTKMSNQFLNLDKQYYAKVHLGVSTDTFDLKGKTIKQSDIIPSLQDIEKAIEKFQGEIDQIPPMFSAKKIGGKKLYQLARKGIEIDRKACKVKVEITLIEYNYPFLELDIVCSKGTYIRSLAADLGEELGCGAHLASLTRLRCGPFHLNDCLDQSMIFDVNIADHLQTEL